MIPIKDDRGRLVCMADQETGLIEVKYKDFSITTHLPPGGNFKAERKNTVVVVVWSISKEFIVIQFS